MDEHDLQDQLIEGTEQSDYLDTEDYTESESDTSSEVPPDSERILSSRVTDIEVPGQPMISGLDENHGVGISCIMIPQIWKKRITVVEREITHMLDSEDLQEEGTR